MIKVIRIFIILTFLMVSSKAYAQNDSCNYKKTYFPSGKVEEEGCELNGKREGAWKDYEEYDGKYYVRFIWTYSNGLKDGPYKVLGEKGNIEAIGHYKSDCLTDTLKMFNENGQLASYSVWKILDEKRGLSEKIFDKTIIESGKPDFTIETIDGKNYIWFSGKRMEVH